MKKLFNEDLQLADVKSYIKKLRRKQRSKKLFVMLGIILAVVAVSGIVLTVLKYKKCCPFCSDMDEFETCGIDLDGSGVYATESDFE